MATYTRRDFSRSPLVVFYELTQACDLICQHCRACAQPAPDPDELRPEQSRRLTDQLATFPKPPLLVLTGGDPLKRADVYDLIRHARRLGLSVAVTPSATPLVTGEALDRLQSAGVGRLAISLDGPDAASHDALRGVAGSFRRTLEILKGARRRGIATQVNTTVTRTSVDQLDQIAELIAPYGITLWSVFFLVPVGRGAIIERPSPDECERAFETLWRQSKRQPYAVKTTEAPHYRRYVLTRNTAAQGSTLPKHASGGPGMPAPLGVNDGKGVMFIGHRGHIQPSGFLPLVGGQFPEDDVVDVYQNSATFLQLRDADLLEGKCGACEFRHICGGSRARSLAETGNVFAAEPACAYTPPGYESSQPVE